MLRGSNENGMLLDVVPAPWSKVDFHGVYFFKAVFEIELQASRRGLNV